jgi:hypothetical protein
MYGCVLNHVVYLDEVLYGDDAVVGDLDVITFNKPFIH